MHYSDLGNFVGGKPDDVTVLIGRVTLGDLLT